MMPMEATKKVILEPCHFPAINIPECKRVRRHVLMENGKIKPLPVLECPASNSTYMFVKKLVQEKSRVMIMLAAVLRESTTPFTGDNGAQHRVFEPQEKVVIKVTDRNYMRNSTELIENPLDEIAAMELLRCPGHTNVLEVLDYMQDNDYLYLVLPFCPGKDLFQRLEARGKPLTERSARRILRQIMHGLLYMKDNHRVAHRDLSLENIMFNEKGEVKIIDLGMCVKMPSAPSDGSRVFITKQSRRGKPGYVAPEIAREEIFDGFAADIWSCGVILFIMMTLTPLYGHPDDNAWRLIVSGQMDVLLDHYETLGIRAPPLARDLVTRMMHPSPEARLTIEEVLSHPWMCQGDEGTAVITPTTTISIVSVAPVTPLVHHRHYCPPITKHLLQNQDSPAAESTTTTTTTTSHHYAAKRVCFDHTGMRRPAPPAAASGGLQYQNSMTMMDEDGYYHN